MSCVRYTAIIVLGSMLFAQVAQAGSITSFTDSQGTLHITNIRPRARGSQENAPDPRGPLRPLSLPPKSPDLPAVINQTPEANAAPIKTLQAEPRPEISPGQTDSGEVRPVTCRTRDHNEVKVTPGVSWSPPSPSRRLWGKIIAFRGPQGVMQITNKPAEQKGAVAPTVGVPEEILSPTSTLPAVQEVSCTELGPEAVAYLKTKLQGFLRNLTGSTIQRFRDHRGIWRIFNQPNPEPQVSPSPVAPGTGLMVPVVAQTPAEAQTLQVVAHWPTFAGVPSRSSDPGVMVRQDPRGLLHIFNGFDPARARHQASPANFLEKVTPLLQACILEAAEVYQLPVPLILALIRQESNFVQMAVSPKGAMGLMQLMPGTAASLGVRDPFDPRENILAGCRYFRFLLDYFQGNVPLAVAGYNAGSRRVVSAGYQVPAIKETQAFVTQVMGLYSFLEQHLAGLQ